MKRWLMVAGVMLSGAMTSGVDAAVAHLTLQSQPGDFIGQGNNFDITYDTVSGATVSAQVRRSISGGPAELLFDLDAPGPNVFALLFFGTDELGIPMQTGTYLNAQRADFAAAGHPGLDVSFQNRGSNTLTGKFTVTDVSFLNGAIQSFSATFEQHSEGATPALFGTFTFAAPEPGTLWLSCIPIGLALMRRRTCC